MSFPRFYREKIKFRSVSDRESKIEIVSTAERALQNIEPVKQDILINIARLSMKIKKARYKDRPVILCMGAHPIKNGAVLILKELIDMGFITHVAANGAAAIHDWEFGRFGKSTECVKTYVEEGQFGLWEETGEFFGLSASSASKEDCGWGEYIGQCMTEDIGGPYVYNEYSLMNHCATKNIPFTIHPGIGQDIIYPHPCMNRIDCSIVDFEIFAESIRHLQGGVYLSVGSSIMSPMIFEKALSMSRNVQHQSGFRIDEFTLAVNDLADSNWDWDQDGEPPMDNPAYYLRFMKSFHRMGGDLRYFGVHNVTFLRQLLSALS